MASFPLKWSSQKEMLLLKLLVEVVSCPTQTSELGKRGNSVSFKLKNLISCTFAFFVCPNFRSCNFRSTNICLGLCSTWPVNNILVRQWPKRSLPSFKPYFSFSYFWIFSFKYQVSGLLLSEYNVFFKIICPYWELYIFTLNRPLGDSRKYPYHTTNSIINYVINSRIYPTISQAIFTEIES